MSAEKYDVLLSRVNLILAKPAKDHTFEERMVLKVWDAVDLLYPDADAGHEWDMDTLEALTSIVREFRPD